MELEEGELEEGELEEVEVEPAEELWGEVEDEVIGPGVEETVVSSTMATTIGSEVIISSDFSSSIVEVSSVDVGADVEVDT